MSQSFSQAFGEALREDREKQEAWTRDMYAAGAKMVHPNDGWVDREGSAIMVQHEGDGVQVGDLIAIGDHEASRLVRVTRIENRTFMRLLHFETMPNPAGSLTPENGCII